MDQDFLFMCGIIVFFTGAFSLSLSGMSTVGVLF